MTRLVAMLRTDGLRLALLPAAVGVGVWLHGVPARPDIDSQAYLALAEGRHAEVVQPYAGRILHPLAARGMRALGLTDGLGPAFAAVAILMLVVFVATLSRLLRETVSGEGQILLLATPVLSLYTVNLYLPDLCFAACLCLMLAFLIRGWTWLALAVLFLLHLTRESAMLVSGVLCVLALIRRRWLLAGGCLGVALAGMMVVGWVAAGSKSNIHEMHGVAYLGAKVVANGAANLLGVVVWSDSYARHFPERYPLAPLWRVMVPAGLPLGGIREVGVYRLEPAMIAETARILLSTFGLLPLLACRLLRERGLRSLNTASLPLQLAAWVGTLFFLLAPFSGRSVDRLAGYGWPLFWLAVPLFSVDMIKRRSGRVFGFLGLSFVCSWVFVMLSNLDTDWARWASLPLISCCYALGWRMIRPRDLFCSHETTIGPFKAQATPNVFQN